MGAQFFEFTKNMFPSKNARNNSVSCNLITFVDSLVFPYGNLKKEVFFMNEKLLKNKWLIATAVMTVIALVATVIAIVLGVSGAPSDDRVYGVGEEGVYYYDVVEGKVTLTLRDGSFTMSGAINKTGVYSVDGSSVNLDFFKDEDGTATATLGENALALVYKDATMSFQKEVEFTVTFNVNGGSEIAPVKVVNGMTVAKPATDPTKGTDKFLGWYADDQFTTPFVFDDVAVKSDITVYARWAQRVAGVPDYVVNFEVGEYAGAEELDSLTTVSGVAALGLPTPERDGYVFGGWYFSMYEDGNKLSYIYKEGTAFTQNTTLYAVWYEENSEKLAAPAVSIVGNTITWGTVNGAVAYEVTIVAPDGTVVVDAETVTATVKDFKFDEKAPGEYKVTVVAVANNEEKNSDGADRYFANKTLDRVNVEEMSVENGWLIFNAVENAQKYLITIDCGNDNHSHTEFNNGASTVYNIANCQMQKGGIKVTVTAVASGYASSVSKVFVYEKNLAGVENLKYDAAADAFVWDVVKGAANYIVTVKVGENTYTFHNGTVTNFSVADYTGEIEVSVVPATEGFNSPDAVSAACTKTAPAAPQNVTASGNTITWDAVEGATSYEVTVGTSTVTVNGTSVNVSEFGLAQGETYIAKVKAVNVAGESSSYSDELPVGYFVLSPELTYNKNTVTWAPVLGVTQYQVRVNGGDVVTVNNVNSLRVVLTKEGENLIEVRYVHEDTISDWVSTTVVAYAVEYDTRTVTSGSLFVEYLAVGDEMTLPEAGVTYEGYHFTGWYNTPKGAQGNGKLYGEGSVFTGNAYTVVYAEWTPNEYNVSLKTDGLNFTITNIANGQVEKVTYTKDFTLPVPEAQNTGMYFFSGWYTGAQGTGVQMTDENGVSVAPYGFTRDITLYPYYSTNALSFELQEDGTYAVKKGETISQVTNLKIPAEYNEIPVTVILETGFSACTTLTSISIPDTIRLVGTGAFNGCSNVKAFEVYESKPGETYEPGPYTTIDGVLLREDMGVTWLEFFPRAKTGEYTIPSTVEKILPKAFYYAKIDKVTISASITDLPEYAFYQCTFTDVVFAGGRTEPITLVKNSFYYCDEVETITLPALINADFSVMKSMLNLFTALRQITVEEGSTAYASVAGTITTPDKHTIVYAPRGLSGDFEIPKGVTAIDASAFENCDNITSVIVPIYVKSIGKYAFRYCDGITSVTFKGGRTENLAILESAFGCVYNLETVTFEGNGAEDGALDSGVISMEKMAFYGASSSSKLHTVTIGDGVNIASLSQQAFQTQSKLREFNISDKAYIGSIGDRAFEKCVSLTSFTVPVSVTKIDTNAFNGCVKLATLDFKTAVGEKALTIATSAFNGCTSLKTINLPDRLSAFDASAFEGCTSLKAITVNDTNPKYLTDENGILYARNVDADNKVVYTELLFYPKALVKENNGIINNLPETLVIIGGSAFSDNVNLEEIVLPGTVTEIGNFAFANCDNLNKVTFKAPAAAVDGEDDAAVPTLTVGDSAFLNCKALTDDFKLPSYTTHIGAAAFQGCEFTKFTIPESVTYIGLAAFWGSETLEEVTFLCTGDLTIASGSANNATKGGAFSNCTALTRVDLPANLTALGAYTFYKSSNLQVVNFGTPTKDENGVWTTNSKLETIGNRAFEQCSAIEFIVIPKTVNAIGQYAFSASTSVTGSLKEVIFEAGGTGELNIATQAFSYQPNLKKIDLPERAILPTVTNLVRKANNKTVTDANGNSVYDAPNTTVTASITLISNVFKACTSLAEINIIDDPAIEGAYTSIDGALYTADKSILVFVPFANVGRYKDGAPTYELVVPNTVRMVITNAIADCTALKTVTFEEFDKEDANYGKQLLTIGNYTSTSSSTSSNFTIGGKTSAITKITLPSHLAKIGYNAFLISSTLADYEPMEIIFNLEASNVVIDTYAFHYSTVKALALPGVKSIGKYAFKNAEKMESLTFVSLDSSITTLPDYMLQNAKSLKSFTIFPQIKTIAQYAFAGCESLTSLNVPSTVTKINNFAFNKTGLTSFTLHSGLTHSNLGTNLFDGCASLKSFTFEAKEDGTYPLTVIPDKMFYNCTALETINLEAFAAQITKIGASAFYHCDVLTAFDFSKFTSLTTVGGNSFSYMSKFVRIDLTKTKITDITSAFNNLANLEEFIFPETLSKNIASNSFTNDKLLKKVTLTTTYQVAWMKNVNSYIVQKSGVPVEIIIPEGNTNFAVDEYGIVYDPAMQTIYFASPTADLSTYVLPATVITIDDYAFAYSTSLKNLVIHEGVTKIGKSAFDYSSIETVHIPASVESIGDYAFRYSNLHTITFTDTVEHPSQLTSIGGGAFNGAQLIEIVIPDKVESFGSTLVFGNMTTLKRVTTGASMKEIPNGFIAYTPSLEELNMQEGIETIRWIFSSNYYIGDEGVHQLKSLHIPASVKTLESDAFCDLVNLKTVTFAEGSQLQNIKAHAFRHCIALETVTGIPASLETIEKYAFADTAITSLDLGATSVTAIAEYAFHNTEALTEIALPQGLISIAQYAFYNSGVKDLVVPATVNSIGISAFENSALETVTFPTASTMTQLGDLLDSSNKDVYANVFKGTKNLKTVVLPNTITTIARGVFLESGVEEVLMADQNMPSNLNVIYNSAFEKCVNLKEFAHLEQVTEICEKAFFQCESLENTVVSDRLVTLGSMAFGFCNKLSTAYFPASLTYLGGNPYAGVDKAKVSVAPTMNNFVAHVDTNGAVTILDAEMTTIYGVYGASGEYVIPEEFSNASFAPGALAGNLITSATIPARATTVIDYLFMNCPELVNITLSDEITAINQYAFYNTGLTTIVIPASVTTIGDCAFMYCEKIDNVVIPKTTTKIGNYVFAYCATLSNFDFESFAEGESSKAQTVGTHFFYNCPNITEVILPDKINLTAEDKAAHGTTYTTDIPSYMFAGTGIVHAVIDVDTNLYLAMSGVFADCKELLTVTFVSYYAHSDALGINNSTYFDGCDKIQGVYIHSIDKSANFVVCSGNAFWPAIHVMDSVTAETTDPLNATAYFHYVTNSDFEIHFDADGYEAIIAYMAQVKTKWVVKMFDKDGNRLICSENSGAIAQVVDKDGNVIWTAPVEAE